MAFQTCEIGGLINDIKGELYDMSLFANVKDRNTNAKTSNFKINTKGKINKGSVNVSGKCNGIPVNCHDWDQFDLTADEQISVNEVFPNCLEAISQTDYVDTANQIAEDWSAAELTFFNSKIQPQFTDLTSEMNDDANIAANGVKAEIIYMVKKLTDLGYQRKDITVVANSASLYDEIVEELGCCDGAIDEKAPFTRVQNKLGLQNILIVDDLDVISGNFDEEDLTPETTVRMMAYVKEYNLFKTFCENQPTLRNIQDVNIEGDVSQVIGKEWIGAGSIQFDDDVTGFIEYESATETV